jgi:uncharacterized membrane protein
MLRLAPQEIQQVGDKFARAVALIDQGANWLRLGLEAIGAAIIVFGAAATLIRLISAARSHRPVSFNAIRLGLARYLALALEFQLGADILLTSVSPGWQKIGELAAIAAIRTALNFFLAREMREERELAARRLEGSLPESGPAPA